jgi:hypothetical protein
MKNVSVPKRCGNSLAMISLVGGHIKFSLKYCILIKILFCFRLCINYTNADGGTTRLDSIMQDCMQYFKENLMCPPTKDIYTSQYSWCPFITVIIGIFSFKSVFTVEDWTQWPGRIILL